MSRITEKTRRSEIRIQVLRNGYIVNPCIWLDGSGLSHECMVFKSLLELHNWLDENLSTPSDWKGEPNGSDQEKTEEEKSSS